MSGKTNGIKRADRQEPKRPHYKTVYDDLKDEVQKARWAVPAQPSQTVSRLAKHIHRIDSLVDELQTALWLDDWGDKGKF